MSSDLFVQSDRQVDFPNAVSVTCLGGCFPQVHQFSISLSAPVALAAGAAVAAAAGTNSLFW